MKTRLGLEDGVSTEGREFGRLVNSKGDGGKIQKSSSPQVRRAQNIPPPDTSIYLAYLRHKKLKDLHLPPCLDVDSSSCPEGVRPDVCPTHRLTDFQR